MNNLERVARALATAFNNADDDAWERFVDEAQAAIDAMEPEWQPIETAPKDGS